MQPLSERCAGLDVHRVRTLDGRGGRVQDVPTFATNTSQLRRLRLWLADNQVTVVDTKSTGVYWKPVYYLMEDDFECWLVNAHHLHNVA